MLIYIVVEIPMHNFFYSVVILYFTKSYVTKNILFLLKIYDIRSRANVGKCTCIPLPIVIQGN